MFESDADRLAEIKALGGLCVSTDAGTLWAIFDAQYVDPLEVEETGPALTARSSDVERLRLRKGAAVRVEADEYRVRAFEPDGTGMTIVRLGV